MSRHPSNEWYLNDDDTKGCILQSYDDWAGLVAHAARPAVQGRIGDLLETAGITSAQVFGNPDAQAQEVAASLGAVAYRHYDGFTR